MALRIITGFRVLAVLMGVVSIVVPAAAVAIPAGQDDWPPDGSFIRVTRDGGVGPFSSIYYDVTVRGSTVVVTLVKDTGCRTAQRERVALLGGADADEAIARLRAAGAWSIQAPADATVGRAADSAAPTDMARWEFFSADGRELSRFFVSDQVFKKQPVLVGLVAELRGLVRGLVEPLPMRDVFHPADQIGFLGMTSTSPAKALIDGWDRVRLPTTQLDLKAGIHEVTVYGDNGVTRTFTVRIVAGETTTVHVLLDEVESAVPAASSTSGP